MEVWRHGPVVGSAVPSSGPALPGGHRRAAAGGGRLAALERGPVAHSRGTGHLLGRGGAGGAVAGGELPLRRGGRALQPAVSGRAPAVPGRGRAERTRRGVSRGAGGDVPRVGTV